MTTSSLSSYRDCFKRFFTCHQTSRRLHLNFCGVRSFAKEKKKSSWHLLIDSSKIKKDVSGIAIISVQIKHNIKCHFLFRISLSYPNRIIKELLIRSGLEAVNFRFLKWNSDIFGHVTESKVIIPLRRRIINWFQVYQVFYWIPREIPNEGMFLISIIWPSEMHQLLDYLLLLESDPNTLLECLIACHPYAEIHFTRFSHPNIRLIGFFNLFSILDEENDTCHCGVGPIPLGGVSGWRFDHIYMWENRLRTPRKLRPKVVRLSV